MYFGGPFPPGRATWSRLLRTTSRMSWTDIYHVFPSAPGEEFLFCLYIFALGLSRLLTYNKITVAQQRSLCRKGFVALVHVLMENLLHGLKDGSGWLGCSSSRSCCMEKNRKLSKHTVRMKTQDIEGRQRGKISDRDQQLLSKETDLSQHGL